MEQRSEGQGGCRWLREGGRNLQAEDRVRVKTQKWMGQGVLEELEETVGMLGGEWGRGGVPWGDRRCRAF